MRLLFIAPYRRRRGATLTQVASVVVIAVLVLFFLTTIRQILNSGPGEQGWEYEAELNSATQHERDPILHRLGMMRQWRPKWLVSRETYRQVKAKSIVNIVPALRHRTSYVAMRVTGHPLGARHSVFATPASHRLSRVEPISLAPAAPAVLAEAPVQAADVDTVRPSSVSQAIEPFHAIIVGPSVRLTLRVGSAQDYSLGCSAADNQRKLNESVVDGVLHLQGADQMEVVATTPKLDRLEISGDSVVNCTGAYDRTFNLVATGNSTVELNGQAGRFQLDLSGNSRLRGSNLTANQLQAGVSGGSSMELGGEFRHLVLNAEAGSSLRTSGHVRRLDLFGTSGSSVDCSGLSAEHVEADASLGVSMKVCATKTLAASAKMSSQIQYSGNPHKVSVAPDESSKIFL